VFRFEWVLSFCLFFLFYFFPFFSFPFFKKIFGIVLRDETLCNVGQGLVLVWASKRNFAWTCLRWLPLRPPHLHLSSSWSLALFVADKIVIIPNPDLHPTLYHLTQEFRPCTRFLRLAWRFWVGPLQGYLRSYWTSRRSIGLTKKGPNDHKDPLYPQRYWTNISLWRMLTLRNEELKSERLPAVFYPRLEGEGWSCFHWKDSVYIFFGEAFSTARNV